MKLILSKRQIDVQGGYKSINYNDLDQISDGEAFLIYLDDFLIPSFTFEELHVELDRILRKVAYNGSIILRGVDISLYCKHIVWNLVGEETKQAIMANNNNAITWKFIRDFMTERGFVTKRVELDTFMFSVEGIRKGPE